MILRQKIYVACICENLEDFLKFVKKDRSKWWRKEEIDKIINKLCNKKIGTWSIPRKAEYLRLKFFGLNDARIIEEILKYLPHLFYVEISTNDEIHIYKIFKMHFVGGQDDEEPVY